MYLYEAKAQEGTRHGAAIAIMRHMGWGWRQLNECPAEVVGEIAERMEAEAHYRAEKEKLLKAMGK